MPQTFGLRIILMTLIIDTKRSMMIVKTLTLKKIEQLCIMRSRRNIFVYSRGMESVLDESYER